MNSYFQSIHAYIHNEINFANPNIIQIIYEHYVCKHLL